MFNNIRWVIGFYMYVLYFHFRFMVRSRFQRIKVPPSVPLPFQRFSWIGSSVFSVIFLMVLGAYMEMCMTEPDFLKNFFYPINWKKLVERVKLGFFKFIEKFGHSVFLNFLYKATTN